MAGSDADPLESVMSVVPLLAKKSADKTKQKPAVQKGKKKVKAGLKGASKQNSAKSFKTKTVKKEACAQPANATQVAEYKVDAYPTDRDNFLQYHIQLHLFLVGKVSHHPALDGFIRLDGLQHG